MDSFRCHADFQEDVFPIAAFISLNLQNHETHCCCPNETAAVANYDSHPDCWINVCSLSENVSNSCLKEETFFGARGNLRQFWWLWLRLWLWLWLWLLNQSLCPKSSVTSGYNNIWLLQNQDSQHLKTQIAVLAVQESNIHLDAWPAVSSWECFRSVIEPSLFDIDQQPNSRHFFQRKSRCTSEINSSKAARFKPVGTME